MKTITYIAWGNYGMRLDLRVGQRAWRWYPPPWLRRQLKKIIPQ